MRALVREPATSDGRIQSGDKILAVNGVSVLDMTHEQAVIFLRQQPDAVRLRLYRDDGQLSASATSPSDSDYRSYAGNTNTSTMKRKANLRPEAINLLSDLANRKNTQSSHSSDGNSDNSSFQSLTIGSSTSPRRLRKNVKGSVKSASGESDANNSSDATIRSNGSSLNMHQTYIVSNSGNSSGTMTPYSDSSADTLTVIAQNGAHMQQYYDPHELVAIIPDDDDAEGYYDSDELEKLEHDTDTSSPSSSKAKRPGSLNVGGDGTRNASTPVIGRKPFYQFSIATANAYELNNLDNAVLDAPTSYKMGNGGGGGCPDEGDQMCDQENTFISLPCETLLLACRTEDDLRKSEEDTCLYVTKFNRNQPMYQSAQVQLTHKTGQCTSDTVDGGEMNLLKWKGVTMAAESDAYDDDVCSVISSMTADTQSSLPSVSAIQRISIRNAQKDLNLHELGVDSNTHNVSFTR